MYEIVDNIWILQAVQGLAYLRFILRDYGCDVDSGIVLVADSNCEARLIEKAFLEVSDARQILKWNEKADRPLNYQMGVHLYQKFDKDENVIDFLQQSEFLPVVIVGGIVPDILQENAYIFRLTVTDKDILDFYKLYMLMKDIVSRNLSLILYQLDKIDTLKAIKQCNIITGNKSRILKTFLAVGKVWQVVMREKNEEEVAEEWFGRYLQSAVAAIVEIERFDGMYNVQDAVKRCILDYVKKNKIEVIGMLGSEQESEKTILFDEEYYYLPEQFLKIICQPLLGTISFLQLKNEMDRVGMLECNNNKSKNLTIKKVIFDPKTGISRRTRFIKIYKIYIETDDGLPLEYIGEGNVNDIMIENT